MVAKAPGPGSEIDRRAASNAPRRLPNKSGEGLGHGGGGGGADASRAHRSKLWTPRRMAMETNFGSLVS